MRRPVRDAEDEPARHPRTELPRARRERRERGPRLVREEERQLERPPEQARVRDGALERRRPLLRLEVQVRPQVVEPQRTQALGLGRAERDEAGPGQTERRARQPPARIDAHDDGLDDAAPPGQGAAERRGLAHGLARLAEQAERDRLPDARALHDLDRERQGERRAVGLERVVGPVALVLGLEGLALHAQLGLDTGRHLVRDRAQAEERLVRRDEPREDACPPLAVDGLDRAGTAGARGRRMQHAEADPVAEERRAGAAVERVDDAAVGAALDPALPVEGDRPATVTRDEMDAERLGIGLDRQVLDLAGHGRPARLTQREVDPAQHLALAEPDPAQLATIEDDAQRTRTQRDGEPRSRVDLRGGRGLRALVRHRDTPCDARAPSTSEYGAAARSLFRGRRPGRVRLV